MLELIDVTAGYNGVDIIKNISAKINNGENLSIIGPNGCGKTTLLKSIVNIIPSKGQIKIDGKMTTQLKRKEMALQIAMMGQISSVYFSFSIFETVMLGRYLHTKSNFFSSYTKNDIEKVNEKLDMLDLYNIKDRQIVDLSGGQLQRVFLARTLVQEPNIILLDEPTNHLDLKYQIELIEYLRQWSLLENKIVIGVLHDINLAMRLSDNVMVLNNGVVEGYGNSHKVITKKSLKKVYDMDIVSYMTDSYEKWQLLN